MPTVIFWNPRCLVLSNKQSKPKRDLVNCIWQRTAANHTRGAAQTLLLTRGGSPLWWPYYHCITWDSSVYQQNLVCEHACIAVCILLSCTAGEYELSHILVKVHWSKKLPVRAVSIIFPPRSRTRAIVFPPLLIVPVWLSPGLNCSSLCHEEMD